ncbi:MAG: MBL fold metallo-hydrolase [Verrucomicrobiae bacterium]|nr:MBL fold metallo-hydrolase [Verrucomicrobiae bacterium]NNJ86715.1 MBL fold metallo-hydrolase [Akkermansiaceae bacterium]
MPNKIQLTMLSENTASGTGIIGEHGISFLIETGKHTVLFDTGQGMALAHNAGQLGIDLSSLNAIVLSHGHYDHVGGLPWALGQAPQAALHLHPRATEPKYSASAQDGRARRISTPFMEEKKFSTPDRRVITGSDVNEVVPGLWTTGEITRINDYEDTGGPFFLDSALTEPDPLLDDQSMFINTTEGLVVIFGCAHSGVVNTLNHIEQWLGKSPPIRLLIGGLHLLTASEHRMQQIISELKKRQPRQMVFCHCTGAKAIRRLYQEFPAICADGHAGMKITL